MRIDGGRHVRAMGSVEYVRRHPAQVRQTLAMVQLDCVGTAPPARRVYLMGWDEQRRRGLLDVFAGCPGLTVDGNPAMSVRSRKYRQAGAGPRSPLLHSTANSGRPCRSTTKSTSRLSVSLS